VNFYNFKKGKQLVNHIPNSLMVYGKRASLMTILEDKKEEIQMRYDIEVRSFFPEAYRLDILSDLIGFINSQTDGL